MQPRKDSNQLVHFQRDGQITRTLREAVLEKQYAVRNDKVAIERATD